MTQRTPALRIRPISKAHQAGAGLRAERYAPLTSLRLLFGLLVWISSVWVLPLAGQADVVVLADGTEVSGKLRHFQPGEKLTLEVVETGELRSFAEGEYLRLLQLAERKVSLVPGNLRPLDQPVEEVSDRRAVLLMQDGSEQQGKILSYVRGGDIRLEVGGGAVYYYAEDAVRAITYDGGRELAKRYRELSFPGKPVEHTYAFREEGFFNHTTFAFTFGKSQVQTTVQEPIFFPGPAIAEPEVQTTGFNVQHLVGYQFNRWLGAGLGVAYDAYNLDGGEGVLSVMAHYRAYFTRTIRAPYLGLSAGYGFPVLAKDQGFIDSKGGLLFHPELGMRLGASEQANFTVSLGYRWQGAYYVQEEPFSRRILYRDLVYRRLVFSLGMIF